jgi:tRNA modification GTPase
MAEQHADTSVLSVSGVTGDGLIELKRRVRSKLIDRYDGAMGADRAGYETVSIDARRRQSIQTAAMHLSAALEGLSRTDLHLDMIAEDLRLTQSALGAISGDVDAEGVLDVVFSSFCIGK